MPKNIVQMNNQYIQDEHQRQKYQNEERKKQNRFMGWVLILIILLFILPTYNLAQSYQTKDDEYSEKYERAKYSFSKDGEYIYTIPNLLPK